MKYEKMSDTQLELHPVALASAWEAINALGGVATTDDDKRYVATLNLITGYIDSLWLDSQLAPTDQQLKDYRESFLLPPLDITQEDRDRSYEQNSGWDTQAFCRERQLLAEMRLHGVTKHELSVARRTAEYWKAEHLAGNAELAKG